MSILSNSPKRKHLSPHEIDLLLKACKDHRNRTMILIGYRHGMRVSELINLEWTSIDLVAGTIEIHRWKKGIDSNHPLTGNEIRALRRLKRQNPNHRHVFLSNRRTPMTRQNVHAFFAKLGKEVGFDFPSHFHQLRHSCASTLAAAGHDTRSLQHYMGHKNIQSTVIYTHLNPNRFNGWFKD
jgi:integrase